MPQYYKTCPFLTTENGIESPLGNMCGIHPNNKGVPQFKCLKINCKVWDIISKQPIPPKKI